MKNKNNKLSTIKTSLAGFAFLAFLSVGCSEKMTTQQGEDGDDVAVVIEEVETEKAEQEPAEASGNLETGTKYTYVQPLNFERDDYKLVIDARSTSFKALDMDNNGIVDKEEFYNGLYGLMDADKNDLLDATEWGREDNFLGNNKNAELDAFEDWDYDRNKELSKDEFRNKLASIVDVPDGQKLAQNLYIVWDTDDDDKIEKLELENVVIRFDQDSN